MGAETSVINTNEMQWQMKKSEWKKTRYERRRDKGDGHQHGRKPRIPEPVLIVWKLTYSEEVRGHGTPNVRNAM